MDLSRRRAAPDAGGHTRAFAVLYAAAIPFTVSFWTILVLVPLFALREGYTLGGVGLLAAVPGLLQIGTRLATGAAADAWGEVPLIRVCLLLTALAALPLLAPHPSLQGLVACQILNGVGRGMFWTAAQSYTSRLPGDRPRLMSRIAGTNFIGSLVALPLAGAASQILGYGPTFAAAGALSAIAFGLALALPPNRAARSRAGGSLLDRFPGLLRRRVMWLAMACAFLSAVPNALTLSFFPVYAVHLGLSSAAATALTALRNIGGIASASGFALYRSRGGLRSGLPLALAAMALGLLVAPVGGVGVYAASVTLAGIAGGLVNLYYLTMTSDHSAPEERGAALALAGACWSLSLLVTPAAFGLLAQAGGFVLAFGALAALALAGAVLPRALQAPAA